MNDILYEQTVHRGKTTWDHILRSAFIVILSLFVMFGGFFIGIVAPILAIIIGYLMDRFYFRKIEEDYEYELYNQNLTLSIIGKTEREEVLTVNLTKVDVVAPRNMERIAKIRPDQFHIYSVISKENEPYAILYEENEEKHCILFDPDEDMLYYMGQFLGPRLVVM